MYIYIYMGNIYLGNKCAFLAFIKNVVFETWTFSENFNDKKNVLIENVQANISTRSYKDSEINRSIEYRYSQ